MSVTPQKSSESDDNDERVLVQTLDSGERHSDGARRTAMLKLSRKAQLSAYFTIAAAAFGLIR